MSFIVFLVSHYRANDDENEIFKLACIPRCLLYIYYTYMYNVYFYGLVHEYERPNHVKKLNTLLKIVVFHKYLNYSFHVHIDVQTNLEHQIYRNLIIPFWKYIKNI